LVVHSSITQLIDYPQIGAEAHDSASHAQALGMTASKESAQGSVRRKAARRKAQRRRRRHRSRSPQPVAQTRLKICRPDDLLAIIPYMIGFHPEEDLVTVLIKSGRVKLTTRTDIPPESAGDDLAGWIDALAKREGAEALALVAYSAAALPAQRLLTRLMDRLGDYDLTDVLYVGHGRWWSLTCGEECCPLAGSPYDLTSHPISAAAVFAGLGVRASRRELEASVSGPAKADLERLSALAEAVRTELEQFDKPVAVAELLVSTMDRALADPSAPDERSSLLLALLVADVHVRDLTWAQISPSDAEEHIRLWAGVVSQVPPVLAAAPLCLLGIAAWVAGHGALLNCCCERVLQIHPDYSMGRLLADISARAIPPSIWQEIRDDMRTELGAKCAPLAG
jgi:Domain of unknown function (DUF4192)